jgi:D-lyxose ketol-isomerase
MITAREHEQAQRRALRFLRKAGIALTKWERGRIEVADFGLSDLEATGLEILTYVNTSRVCAKELVLFPHQTCPEHKHPRVGGRPGKEETFRCRYGTVYLYVPGRRTSRPRCRLPVGREGYYTVRHEVKLRPGEQYTLMPETPHWFQAGGKGAVVSEFSTRSIDKADIFTDPEIVRATRYKK